MTLRVALAVLVLANAAQACSCIAITPSEALANAHVVFRGTVIEVRDAERDIISDILQPPKHIAVFRVNRVWKGDVGERFEILIHFIPSSTACSEWGKFAVVGNELLVYARRSGAKGEYTTSFCYRTALVSNAALDVRELGPRQSA